MEKKTGQKREYWSNRRSDTGDPPKGELGLRRKLKVPSETVQAAEYKGENGHKDEDQGNCRGPLSVSWHPDHIVLDTVCVADIFLLLVDGSWSQ